MPSSNTTIRDVAKKAGVSVATVSYVLNGRAGVAQATRERVLETMRELSYFPSASARSLVRQRTHLIGCLIPSRPDSVFLDPYFAELIRGVAIMADAQEYSPLLVTVEGELHAHVVYSRIVQNNLVDGILISYVSEQNTYLLNEMERDGIPYVAVGSVRGKGGTVVDIDNRGGAEQAVEHLVGLGHRVIGFINGPDDAPHARQRLRGFHSGLQAHGIDPHTCPVANGGFSREGGYGAMLALLRTSNPPTAVFVASDQMAIGASQCLHERGLRIPDDISLMSFDDTLLATATYPTLTTVRQPIRQLGEMATDLLLKKIFDLPTPSSIILPTELVVRDSTRALG